MKLKVPIVFLILALPCLIEAQENKWVPANYKDLSFKEFVSVTQPLLKVKFFYRDEWVRDLKMGIYPESFTLSDVLDNLLNGTSIYYFVDRHGNVVLTKNYEVRIPDVSYNRETSFIPGSVTSFPMKGGQGNTPVVVGNPAKTGKQGTAVVSGYVTDSETKELLVGVTVSNKNHSAETFTNGSGFYSLILPPGIHTLTFSSLGMREKTITLKLIGDGEMNVELTSEYIPLKETLIFARRRMVLQRFEAGVENINITSLKLSPTSLGEADIVNSILLVPGVKSVGEGSAGFNVRGGSADQNLILLYGAPLFNSSHFFGFFSAINPDIIKDVSLYKGGIPSRYGGRISSVLDISASEGNKKVFEGSAGISPVATHITIQGPLKKDTLSYILSLRNTYSNWILGLIQDPTLRRSRASFYDINGKVTYDINKSDKVEAASYFSQDAFRLGSDSLYRYNNHILALKWQHIFSSTFFSALSINESFSEYNISSHESKTESFILSHKINSTKLRADFNWFRQRNEFNFGLDLNAYKVLPGSYKPANDSSLVIPLIIDRERALEASLYFDDKFRLTDYLSVNAGIRISSYFSMGPSTVLVYQKGFSKSPSSVVDTLNFRSLEVSKLYGGPELRFSLNFRTSDNSSLKINYNRTRQYLHLISNSTSIAPTDTWKLSDYNLKPQVGDQFALGFYQMLFNNRFETSADIYYKAIRNMADFKGGAKLIMNESIVEEIVNVRGRAYGLELLLKKTEGKLRFSLGYTYSRIFIRSLSNLREEIINEGKWFPANFDKPGDLSFNLNYLLARRFSFSGNYTWNSGRPITFPVATYVMYENTLVHYSDRNKYRIPDYSRLDLSIKVGGNLRAHQIAYPYWTFSVYNLLGRQNVYSIYFKKEADVYKGYKLAVFAKAIPSVTFSFDFKSGK